MPTTDEILKERGKEYGAFALHAKITQKLYKELIDHAEYFGTADFTTSQKEALHMICHKLGRIVNGNPNNEDSWDDIAGYAKLAADDIRREKEFRSNGRTIHITPVQDKPKT